MVKIIAHRGGAGLAPENSITALRICNELEVDYVELDVRVTKDGHHVCIHDSFIDRISKKTGSISNLSLKSLKKISFFQSSKTLFGAAHIMPLEQVFETVEKPHLLLDIKDAPADSLNRLCDAVQDAGLERKVVLGSPDKQILQSLFTIAPHIPRACVTGLIPLNWARTCVDYRCSIVFQQKSMIDKVMVRKAHTMDLEMFGWTANTEYDMLRLLRTGVDGIGTDYPTRYLGLQWLLQKFP